MKLQNEHIQAIKKDFASMQSKEDLLNLLNFVKRIEYGEKCFPFEARQLNYHINPKLNPRRYRQFEVKKKSGGERTICSPNRGLKEIQSCLNIVLQALYDPHKNAYGFIPSKSIVEHAKNHTGSIYIYNIDLKDFFSSINQARIWGRLQHPPFNLHTANNSIKIANMIASLCCHEMEVERLNESGNWETVMKRVLPQGAPTSPVLTNIICERLDYLLTGVAKRFGLRYSRYADDITFSSMHNVYQKDSDCLKELERIVKEQGFTIKQSKTRLQKTGYRQEVTGLLVNDKVNVQKRYVKQLRKWLYYWETYGFEKAYAFFLPAYMEDKGHVVKRKPDMTNVLAGKLEFLKMVKGYKNQAYLKLHERFEKLVSAANSGGFITSILDVWERDGIEKAMELFNRGYIPVPVEDIFGERLAEFRVHGTFEFVLNKLKTKHKSLDYNKWRTYKNAKGEDGFMFQFFIDKTRFIPVWASKSMTVKADELPSLKHLICQTKEGALIACEPLITSSNYL